MSKDSDQLADLSLDSLRQASAADGNWQKPHRYNLEGDEDRSALDKLIKSGGVRSVRDSMDLIIGELFDISHPDQKDKRNPSDYEKFSKPLLDSKERFGEWFYFPWSKELVRYPNQDDLRMLRTAKNRNLITTEEQKRLYKSTVAVFGLSVGSNVVEALVSSGIGGKIVLADMDIIEPTNLNRIRADFTQVGVSKVDYVAKRISMIDPYIEQVHLPEGLDAENLEELIQNHRPSVLIDEVDSLPVKIFIRKTAKEEGIPVLMATDDGDNALVDVERYDLADTELFDGRMPEDVISMVMSGTFPRDKLGFVIGKHFVGAENIPLRMFQSLGEVGKTLPSWPQLGGSAALGGVAIAYAARRVILGQDLPTSRVVVSLDDLLNSDIETKEYQKEISFFRNKLRNS